MLGGASAFPADAQPPEARARAEAEARRAAAQAEAEARRVAAAGDQSRAAAAATATGETASERPAGGAPGVKNVFSPATEKNGDAGARATAVGPAIVVRAPSANAPPGGSAKGA